LELKEVRLEVPEGSQLIVGQSHFIKTVEDLFEALSTSVPGLKFGIAFCEASGKALVRCDGSDEDSTSLATDFALRLGSGHSFVVVLKDAFPINVLHKIRSIDEVVSIFCATSNPVTLVVAATSSGRGILGVVDGVSTVGLETEADKAERREFLRKIGYKK